MNERDLRIDPLTGNHVLVTPWRQSRPSQPTAACPFCPGGLEAPEPYEVRWIRNRWPSLPDGRHEVILHSPRHNASFLSLGPDRTAGVVELWSARTAVLGARADVSYVFVFENQGRSIGATIDHPHSQILAFGIVPPVAKSELSAGDCLLCREPDPETLVFRQEGWSAQVPRAASWPYEMLIAPFQHAADLPAAGRPLRTGLAAALVEGLARLERILGAGAPYMLWVHQRPADGAHWPAAHLHLHLVPVLRTPEKVRHLASAELGAGVLVNPVDPAAAAAALRSAGTADGDS